MRAICPVRTTASSPAGAQPSESSVPPPMKATRPASLAITSLHSPALSGQ
jgi:hypothetical protein